MSVLASPISFGPSDVPAVGARSLSSQLGGFADLDGRLAGSAGVLLVCTSSPEAALAITAHVERRTRALGYSVVRASARPGAPLWREVACRLGLPSVECDPQRCAEQIGAVATSGRAAIVMPLPAPGTWDRSVAAELALLSKGSVAGLSAAPLTILVTDKIDAAKDVLAERFDVSPRLDDGDRRRWWSAVADDADDSVASGDLTALESWWENARRAPRSSVVAEVPAAGMALFTGLALAGRPWYASATGDLAGSAHLGIRPLVEAYAVRVDRGWLAIEPGWEGQASEALASATDDECRVVAAGLSSRFKDEPWAHARAAELLIRAGDADEADREHALAVSRATDPLARRELVSRWMDAVDGIPRAEQLALRMRAAERALAVGEADEASRWAQTASAIAPDNAKVTLLLGRAAVALGDLVAARVALERGLGASPDPESAALLAVELAEVAYLRGELAMATREAHKALELSPALATVLRARNTVGKVLLAESKYAEADRHFAEDAQTASSHGDTTAELRARLNRGIAFLSQGLVDEARSVFEGVYSEGERIGDMRACAFALDNLAVVATWRHEYASALSLSERTLKLRQRLGDRLTMARILANLAELRRKLGLFDHAEHAIAFGRRTLGPGMPPARSAHFSVVAARLALARGHTMEARREVASAIVDGETAGQREFLGYAHRVATRIALEDGDMTRARDTLGRARELAQTDEARAEVALLAALVARSVGESAEQLAVDALALARTCGEEESLREAHVLLSEIHRASGRADLARAHLNHAILLRDQVADGLPEDVRTAFLQRPDVLVLSRLHHQLAAQLAAELVVEQDGPDYPPVSCSPATQRGAAATRSVATQARQLVGDDPAMRGLGAAIKKVARSNSTILVRGESGTGKELVAEALHRASDRSGGPMVTVNCAALVETLLLSELFGHEKGAFTGAVARRRGRFELAEGGTLFLDEIGDISAKTQVALLRVLQERTFERVGGTTPIRVDVRIVCATHRDLRAMVDRGEFREDLYYRLRGITLEVPPLRLRMGDLPRVAENLLSRIGSERGEANKILSSDALDLLSRHRWPGNVRELENVLRAASLFAETGSITAADLIENVDDLRVVAAQVSWGASRSVSERPSPISLIPPPTDAAVAAGRQSVPPVSLGTSSLGSSSLGTSSLGPSSLGASDREGPKSVGLGGVESRDLADGEDGEAPLPLGEAGATAIAYAQVRQGAVSLADMKRQIERDCIARALAETKGNITRAATLLGMKRPRLSQLVKQYGLAAVSSEAP